MKVKVACCAVLTLAQAAFAEDLTLSGEDRSLSEDATYANVTLSGVSSLAVQSGSTLTVESALRAGEADGDNGNAILVSGEGSGLDLTGSPFALYLGNLGNDNKITVKDGATLTASTTSTKNVFSLGNGNTRNTTQGCRNVLTISGSGTTASLYRLTIGTSGCDNKTVVTGGATLSVANALAISSVDRPGTGNELIVTNATVSVAAAGGLSAANTDGGVVVSGSTAEMTVSGSLAIAKKAHLQVQDGASFVVSGKTTFGAAKGGETRLVISGGATLDARGEFYLGNELEGTVAQLSSGAHLYVTNASNGAWVGYNATACSNYLYVSGTGTLAKFTSLKIGDGGSSNAVIVANGGRLEVGELYNGYQATAKGNRLEVLDGAEVSVTTYCKATSGSTNNVIRVRDATLGLGAFSWRDGLRLRLEGSSSRVTWDLNARNGGSPLRGAVLEFVPPANVRTFATPVIQTASFRNRYTLDFLENQGVVLRVADADACMANGGGIYPLLSSPIGFTGSLDNLTTEAPEGTEFYITGSAGSEQVLCVRIPRKRNGFVVVVR